MFVCFSFFPNVLQPIISILVNPIHICFLKVGLIKPPQNVQANLTSVNVTIPGGGVDPLNMERRRQIALKALSERLAKTTDSSRQNLLPKSIPKTSPQFPHQGLHSHDQHHQHHQHSHSHSHHQHHQHQHQHHHPTQQQHQHLPIDPSQFIVPAIPLPPPPAIMPAQPTASSTIINQELTANDPNTNAFEITNPKL